MQWAKASEVCERQVGEVEKSRIRELEGENQPDGHSGERPKNRGGDTGLYDAIGVPAALLCGYTVRVPLHEPGECSRHAGEERPGLRHHQGIWRSRGFEEGSAGSDTKKRRDNIKIRSTFEALSCRLKHSSPRSPDSFSRVSVQSPATAAVHSPEIPGPMRNRHSSLRPRMLRSPEWSPWLVPQIESPTRMLIARPPDQFY